MPNIPSIQYSNNVVSPVYPINGGQVALAFAPGINIKAGQLLAQVSSPNANEVQTFDFNGVWAAGDTFTLSIAGVDGGVVSTTLTLDATPEVSNADLKDAIEEMLDKAGYVGTTVTVANGPAAADLTVTFGGTVENWRMPLITATVVAAGGGTLAIAATVAGNRSLVWSAYDDNSADRNVAKMIASYSFRTDNLGRVIFADTGQSPEHGVYHTTAPAWYKGVFQTSQLCHLAAGVLTDGVDAAAVVDLGRVISGSNTDGLISLI